MVADVTREDQIKAVVDETVKRFGRIDILHNNVGIAEMGARPRPARKTGIGSSTRQPRPAYT